jgi:hypothetical protein
MDGGSEPRGSGRDIRGTRELLVVGNQDGTGAIQIKGPDGDITHMKHSFICPGEIVPGRREISHAVKDRRTQLQGLGVKRLRNG